MDDDEIVAGDIGEEAVDILVRRLEHCSMYGNHTGATVALLTDCRRALKELWDHIDEMRSSKT
jgi:hypothetical protein